MQNKVETKFKETEIGLIPEKWSCVSIADVCTKITKGTTPTTDQGFSDSGIRFFKAENLSDDGRILNEKFTFITEKTNQILKRSILEANDILFTIAGTIGRVAVVQSKDLPANTNQAIAIIRPDLSKIDLDFLKYYLLSENVKNFLTSKTVQGVQANLSLTELGECFLCIPRIDEQTRIAEILSSLDDKIELNRQINANLEKIASALFKRWFVDFEFPDENGKPYKSSGGKMVESELGEIPEGWRVGKLYEIANITIGRTPPRLQEQWFSKNVEDVKWISIRDLGNSGIYVDKTAEFLTREAIEKFNIPIIPKNTVILSFKLTVGRLAITSEEMLSNEAIAHIKLSDTNISTEYIYLALKKFDYSSLGSTSSIATAVNSKSIKDIPLLLPDGKIIRQLTDIIVPIFQSIFENTKQSDLLIEIRDSFLPRLMSGKLRVKLE